MAFSMLTFNLFSLVFFFRNDSTVSANDVSENGVSVKGMNGIPHLRELLWSKLSYILFLISGKNHQDANLYILLIFLQISFYSYGLINGYTDKVSVS